MIIIITNKGNDIKWPYCKTALVEMRWELTELMLIHKIETLSISPYKMI